MKTKRTKILVVALIVSNMALLSALGYIVTLPTEMISLPAVVRYVTNSAPTTISEPVTAATPSSVEGK